LFRTTASLVTSLGGAPISADPAGAPLSALRLCAILVRDHMEEERNQMQKITLIAALLGATALAACGDTYMERGLSGAAIGAGAAAATGNNAATGAAIGAGAGMITK